MQFSIESGPMQIFVKMGCANEHQNDVGKSGSSTANIVW